MSEKSTQSSSKDNVTPQHGANSGAMGDAGFAGEFASQGGDIKSMLNSSSGETPPNPKTVLQMQSMFGNRATLQLLRKKDSESTLQPKKKANVTYPFAGLRMVQRVGGDNPVSEEEDLDLDDDSDDETDFEDDFDDDSDDETAFEDDFDDDSDDETAFEDDFDDDSDDETDFEDDFDDDSDIDDSDVNQVLADNGVNPDDVEPSRWEKFKSGAKVVGAKALEGGKFVGGHALGAAKNIGMGALNATVGLGFKSALDFWKGVLDADKEKQQTLYGDHWKAWSFLENTVNLTQAIADITSSIGFLSLIAGAVTAIVFPPAAPFFVLMSTIAGTFATIAHIITGIGRIILSVKLGTRLSELEDDPVAHDLVKGTMIRQILGAVANTVGAVVGGIGGAFDFGGSGFTSAGAKETVKSLTVGNSIGTGVLNQLKGGSSGDTSNAITEESTSHLVDRKPDGGLLQRADDEDGVSNLDTKISEIQELRTNLQAGLPDIDESISKEEETKTMRQQQLSGIKQSLPQLGELDQATTEAKEQAETAEQASDDLDNQISDVEPPQEKKKGLLNSIKRGAKKALKKFLKAFAVAKRKVMSLIAEIKAKLVKFMMKLLGVDKPAKEIEGVMEEKQEQLPSAMAKQDENAQLTGSVKDEVKRGISDLDKAEEQAQEQKQQMMDG